MRWFLRNIFLEICQLVSGDLKTNKLGVLQQRDLLLISLNRLKLSKA